MKKPLCFQANTRNLLVMASVFLLLVFAGCSTRHTTVVLTPDPSGKVGKATVKNSAGETELSKAEEAVEVKGPKKAPGKPYTITPEEMEKTFGPAISAQPRLPVTFILYFTGGTTELTPESMAEMQKIPAEISGRAHYELSVVGHSDRVGSEEYNLKLSLERANAVKDRLIAEGILPETIQVDSHGEANPLIPTADDVAEPKNRRVEVTIR